MEVFLEEPAGDGESGRTRTITSWCAVFVMVISSAFTMTPTA
ncbi:hypothetical protein [Microterricola viridarii]|nr:hypothetical protein [Microterricola viridarii]